MHWLGIDLQRGAAGNLGESSPRASEDDIVFSIKEISLKGGLAEVFFWGLNSTHRCIQGRCP